MKESSANKLAKECIYTALLQLMEQHPYSEITITDITRRAGVSRMTYYRNYSSKDDILIKHMDEFLCSFEEHITPGFIQWKELWMMFFRHFRQSQVISAVIKADLLESLFQCVSRHTYYIFQELLLWDMEDYHNVLLVNYQTGALLGLVRYVLGEEHNISDKQAATFYDEISAVVQPLAHNSGEMPFSL